MSNPVNEIVAAPRTVIAGVKSRPIMWAVIALIACILVIRFRDKIAKFLVGLPAIGKVFAKLMGIAAPAAVLVFALFGSSDALASTVAHAHSHSGGTLGILGWIAGVVGVGLGMAWNYPTPLSCDLTSDGKITQTLTPGNEQSVDFKIESTKADAGGGFKRVVGVGGRLSTVFDQAASGGSTVNWDELFRMIAGFPVMSPTFGTIIDKATSNGPLLKHVIEFFGNQYAQAEGARAQISASDGDTTCVLYFMFPFAQRNFVRPADFMPWVGWLEKTIARFYLASSTTIAAASTGAVNKATTNVQCWYDYVVDNDVEVPAIAHWQLFTQSASGGKNVLLQNVGANEGLKRVEDYVRIAALLYLADQAGMGGPDGADNITSIEIPKLDFPLLQNIEAIPRAFKATIKGHRGSTAGIGASTPVHDGGGNPELMAGAPNGALNSSTLMYLPIIAPGLETEITKLKKYRGDLLINYGFTTAPSSGNFQHLLCGIRQITDSDAKELAQQAGGRGYAPKLSDGNTAPDAAAMARDGGKRLIGLPKTVLR